MTGAGGWQRSSHCAAGDCIEAASSPAAPDTVLIRRAGTWLTDVIVVNRTEWDAFLAGIKAGEFDDL